MSQRLAQNPSWLSIPAPTQALLAAAAQTWEDTAVSEQYIQQALAQPDAGLAVLVSAYRYYFYKSNAVMALQMATAVCSRIRQSEQWPTDWPTLKPILLARLDDAIARLYLSAYAASGLLLARLGRVAEAQEIAQQGQQIAAKEFGAERLLTILNPPPDEDD
ncbi:MAG: hypothetical protein ACTS3T_03095 [Almyronema sp.]